MQLALSPIPRTRATGAGAAVVLVGAIVAVFALRTARAVPDLGYVAWSPWGAAALLVPGLAAVAVALESLHRRRWDRCALLLAVAGVASCFPELGVPGTRPAAAFTTGLVLAWATPPLVGHLALVYPGRTATRLVGALRNAGYLSAVVCLGLLPALVFDPVETGCGECSTNLALVHSSTGLEAPLTRVGIVVTLVWATLCIVVIGLRLTQATPAARRLLWPVLVPSAALLGCFATELALSLRRAFLSTATLDRELWLGGQAALFAIALGVAARRLRARRAQTLLARDVVELSDRCGSDSVAERLSAVLGDPTLEVAYPVGDPTRYVDAHGSPVDLAAASGQATTALPGRMGEPEAIALVRHREGLLDDPALVEEISHAARLPLANERLRADARARLAQLQASRKRIVAAADAERRRLERDLHDGAQQRMVTLAVAVRAARSADGSDSAALDQAQEELKSALDQLRVIARGIYPAVLAEMGLAAAIEALGETAPLPIKVGTLPDERFDPVVEAAAYFVVAEAVHDPTASRITIDGRRDGDTLILEVATDAPTVDLIRLSDRVGAAGGTIHRRPQTENLILEVELPCGS